MDQKSKPYCSTSGGKGNVGMFIERDPRICAAGVATRQANDTVGDAMRRYTMQDEVDALLGDAIKPKPTPQPRPPLRRPIPRDMRYAGPYCDMSTLINPPPKSKFHQLADDLKETVYKSYWKRVVGQVPDPVPMLPEGMDIRKTTFGKKTPDHGRLYEIIMPREPLPDKTPWHKGPGVQTTRCYFSPPFSDELTFGHRTGVDKRGFYARCCLTDDKKILGTDMNIVVNQIQADFQEAKMPQDGITLAPNKNFQRVPEGHAFGKLTPLDSFVEAFSFCKVNPYLLEFRKSLKHLNTLRINLSKRFIPTYFRELYQNLKYFDKNQTGWLGKQIIYNFCGIKLIRFDPNLIEPLLTMLEAFDGNKINYEIFVKIINYREPIEGLPHVEDVDGTCLDFRTTYTEMVKPGQEVDPKPEAGLPCRRLDVDYPITPSGCCKADQVCLMDECDVKSRVAPSVFQLMNVSHRDMFEKREQCVVKRVFEGAGEKFTDEKFCEIWEEAAKQHPEGWVCYETFRNVLDQLKK